MCVEEALDSWLSEVGGAKLVVFAVDARIGQHVTGISGNTLKQKLDHIDSGRGRRGWGRYER